MVRSSVGGAMENLSEGMVKVNSGDSFAMAVDPIVSQEIV